jgi:hypothetical protein
VSNEGDGIHCLRVVCSKRKRGVPRNQNGATNAV